MRHAFLIWSTAFALSCLAACGGKVVVDDVDDDGAEAQCLAFCANTEVHCDSGAGGGGFSLQITPNASGCDAVEMVNGETLVLSIDCAARELCNVTSGSCSAATFSAAGATLPLGFSGAAACSP
jgi:hypothetical protein